tara:strand:+ start:3174 stop:4067 length:894 start_codon:yes stop_codon:yes gene_type:complete
MKICIFGGNGFIGGSLAKEYLRKGHKVHIYSQTKVNRSFKFKNNTKIKYNEKNFKLILKKKFDIIFFFSGNSNQETSKNDIYYDLETTFNSYVSLLEAAKKINFKFPIWFASSVVVYGSNNKPLKENFDLNPLSFYAVTKLICEIISKFYSKNHNLNIGILRIFSTFGPGLKRQVVYDTIKKIKTMKSFKVIGSGNEKRDFGFINDQIKSIILLSKKVKKPKGEAFNIASGRAYTIKSMLNKLVKISKKKISYTYTNKRRSFDTKSFISNKSKINKTIGSVKNSNFDLALKETFKAF